MEWNGSNDKIGDDEQTLADLSAAHLYIQRNKADSADLLRAKATFGNVQIRYRACREAGDLDGFLRLEAGSQRFDRMISAEDRAKKFFENQYNEIYKIAKAWEDMQDPKKVRDIYGKIAAQTGMAAGDVMVNRYVNAEIRGLIPILFHTCLKAAVKAGERPPVGRVRGGSPDLEL